MYYYSFFTIVNDRLSYCQIILKGNVISITFHSLKTTITERHSQKDTHRLKTVIYFNYVFLNSDDLLKDPWIIIIIIIIELTKCEGSPKRALK